MNEKDYSRPVVTDSSCVLGMKVLMQLRVAEWSGDVVENRDWKLNSVIGCVSYAQLVEALFELNSFLQVFSNIKIMEFIVST